MNKQEIEKEVFLQYGNCIEIKKLKEDNDINDEFTVSFNMINERKNEKFKLYEILYTNIYWKDKNKEQVYKKLDDIDDYKKNTRVFEIRLKDGRVLNFIPDYISIENDNLFLHYFDKSYFFNELLPRDIFNDILSHFNGIDVTFEFIDYLDI